MNQTRQNEIVAVFGSKGSFTEQAAMGKFGKMNKKYKYFEGIPQLLKHLENNECSIGVIPFTNNNVGHVEMTQNLLANYQYTMLGKIRYDIDLYLLAKKILPLDEVEEVASHPHALLQCSKFISSKLPNARVVSSDSTSHAAMYLSHDKYGDNTAVIASRQAGTEYGLVEIGQQIQDKKKNFTEFLIIKVDRQQD